MPEHLSREHALRVLALASTADLDAVKRAYRRLAREHHPDLGGDPEIFHELQQAFERLMAGDAAPSEPTMSRGQPSRPTTPFADDVERADLDSVDWSVDAPRTGMRLDRDLVAAALDAADGNQVAPLSATSRSPGSRLNPVAPHLADNLTARLRIAPGTDDRDRQVVTIELRAGSRRNRRVLDDAALLGVWTRIRGSSSTSLRSSLVPSHDRRATIVRIADRTEELLDGLAWGLPAWTLTDG